MQVLLGTCQFCVLVWQKILGTVDMHYIKFHHRTLADFSYTCIPCTIVYSLYPYTTVHTVHNSTYRIRQCIPHTLGHQIQQYEYTIHSSTHGVHTARARPYTKKHKTLTSSYCARQCLLYTTKLYILSKTIYTGHNSTPRAGMSRAPFLILVRDQPSSVLYTAPGSLVEGTQQLIHWLTNPSNTGHTSRQESYYVPALALGNRKEIIYWPK